MERLIEKLASLGLKSISHEEIKEIAQDYSEIPNYRGLFMFLNEVISQQYRTIKRLFPGSEPLNYNSYITEEMLSQEGIKEVFDAILKNEKLFIDKLNECSEFVDELVNL